MLDEDTVIKTLRNNNELLLLYNVLCVIILPTIFFGAHSELLTGIFISLGIVAPINICKYIASWSPRPIIPLRQMLMYTLPWLISLAITVCGMCNGGLQPINMGEFIYFELLPTNKFSPMNAYEHALAPLSAELISLSAFLVGLSVFMITDSRFVIRKILISASIAVSALMIVGVLFNFLGNFEESMYTKSYSRTFATFVDSSQWASFAILWIGASFAMALYSGQRFRILSFLYSMRFMGLTLAIILFVGVLFAGKPIHHFFAYLISAISLTLFAIDVAPIKKNARRHEMLRHISSHTMRLKKMRPTFAMYLSLALFMYVGAIYTAMQVKTNPKYLIVDYPESPSITYAEKISLWEDSVKMFDNNHILFGYGTASYPNVFAFYQGSDLDSAPWTSPQSDLLQKLLENGVVGLVLSSLTFTFLFLRWIFKRQISSSGAIMMLSVFALLAISIVEIPFQSIAILSSFWVLAMSTFRWDDSKVG